MGRASLNCQILPKITLPRTLLTIMQRPGGNVSRKQDSPTLPGCPAIPASVIVAEKVLISRDESAKRQQCEPELNVRGQDHNRRKVQQSPGSSAILKACHQGTRGLIAVRGCRQPMGSFLCGAAVLLGGRAGR